MSRVFFIADLHFNDSRILLYENRPFSDTKQMNDVIIGRWNSVVTPDDEVYVLGDFGAEGSESEFLQTLNGNKYLIKGNHDNKPNNYYRQAEELAKKLSKKRPKKTDKSPTANDIEIERISEKMTSALGTKVKITQTAKKGRIEIEYYGNDDLERLLNLLKITQ